MALSEPLLAKAALRAYERGRLRCALRVGWLLAPMIALSCLSCGRTPLSLVTGMLLFAVTVALGWRGEAYGAAVVPGLCAGSAPLLLPILVGRTARLCLGGLCGSLCGPMCFLGGLIAGIVLGARGSRFEAGRSVFLGSGLLIAGLTGVLGCALGGALGVLGMLVGMLLGTVPVALAMPLRRS